MWQKAVPELRVQLDTVLTSAAALRRAVDRCSSRAELRPRAGALPGSEAAARRLRRATYPVGRRRVFAVDCGWVALA
jgi:hypothetical protein